MGCNTRIFVARVIRCRVVASASLGTAAPRVGQGPHPAALRAATFPLRGEG